jgi:hypothetical protein
MGGMGWIHLAVVLVNMYMYLYKRRDDTKGNNLLQLPQCWFDFMLKIIWNW